MWARDKRLPRHNQPRNMIAWIGGIKGNYRSKHWPRTACRRTSCQNAHTQQTNRLIWLAEADLRNKRHPSKRFIEEFLAPSKERRIRSIEIPLRAIVREASAGLRPRGRTSYRGWQWTKRDDNRMCQFQIGNLIYVDLMYNSIFGLFALLVIVPYGRFLTH